MSKELQLESFLLMLDTERARLMLEDLRDPSRRSPQLYNAIEKMLSRYNFQISKVTVDDKHLAEMEELNAAYEKSLNADDSEYPLQ